MVKIYTLELWYAKNWFKLEDIVESPKYDAESADRWIDMQARAYKKKGYCFDDDAWGYPLQDNFTIDCFIQQLLEEDDAISVDEILWSCAFAEVRGTTHEIHFFTVECACS